ncbi:uncharacterized protein LOC127076201 [Lathyrus oleraceus]|uniref:Remorin C-terminal domain-containing protein n=1 Tax=Pisum sativum TaxID=3888 RepID=A0A9D4XLM5_PEA|nr:uncharacterized protein LOC127076201 [Pisum sativum]KAI5422254.1 hypothetical protein KIW84_045639 [Pisum sativum]
MYAKNKDYYTNNNPFVDDFIDPLCKLNLRETSEFVKSFPLPKPNAENTRFSNDSSTHLRKLEPPSTPGRPLFSFTSSPSSSIVGRNNLPRKSFPSKWDDAEKWLISTSCHDSPAHNNNNINLKAVPSESSNIGAKQCDNNNNNSFKQKMEEKVSKVVTKCQSSSSTLDHNNSLGAFNGISYPTDIVLKDKFTDSIEPVLPKFIYSEPTKEGFLFKNKAYDESMNDAAYTEVIHEVKHKDVGTEMTPLGSSTTSRCHTPFKSSSPARHNTPASRSGPLALDNVDGNGCSVDGIKLEECHFDKLQFGTAKYDLVAPNWSSSEEEEKEISKSLRHNASLKADSDCIASTWEEEEKNKCCLRYQREEAKIQAWINLQNAKAEARSRKLEVKIQKMKSNLEEKLMKRMSVVHRKAEEWRETARQQHLEQMEKSTQHAKKIIHKHNSQFSRYNSCGCFPCNNNH